MVVQFFSQRLRRGRVGLLRPRLVHFAGDERRPDRIGTLCPEQSRQRHVAEEHRQYEQLSVGLVTVLCRIDTCTVSLSFFITAELRSMHFALVFQLSILTYQL